MSECLHGKTIVVTRPLAQAARLADWIAERGGQPVVFPLLEISPADDPQPLQRAIANLDSYCLAIFISPNAVDHSVPAILARRSWPAGLRAVAIGQASVAALANYGIDNTLAPVERFDSEALLELPELQEALVSGHRVVIFRGNGGRELLADADAVEPAENPNGGAISPGDGGEGVAAPYDVCTCVASGQGAIEVPLVQQDAVGQQFTFLDVEQQRRIQWFAQIPHLEMQVAAGGTPGITSQPDHIPGLEPVSLLHGPAAQMGVQGLQPVLVPDHHHVAIPTIVA